MRHCHHLIRDRFYSFATVVGIGFLLLVFWC